MSISDAFRASVEAVPYDGDVLALSLQVSLALVMAQPDDEEALRQVIDDRNALRCAGEEVSVAALSSDSSETESAADDTSEAAVESAPPGNTAAHDDAGHEDRADSRDGSGFVSPASLHSDNSLLRSSSKSSSDDASTSSPSADAMAALTRRLGITQLELFDQDRTAWMKGFICTTAKLFLETTNEYIGAIQSLHFYMSVRRRRVEQRSEYLRQQLQGQTHIPVPVPATAATTASLSPPSSTASSAAPSDVTDDDVGEGGAVVEGFHVSRAVKEMLRPPQPDNVLRQQENVVNFFLSCYASLVLQDGMTVAMMKRVAGEVRRICLAAGRWARRPIDLTEQYHADREAQALQFLTRWLETAQGHLVTLMAVPPAAESAVTPRSQQREEEETVYTTGGGTPRPSSPTSTMGEESVMDAEGHLLQHRSVPGSESDDLASAAEDSEAAAAGDGGSEKSTARFVGPKTEPNAALALVEEHVMSEDPCDTALAHLVASTVPGKGTDALLPCTEQPERRSFNDGYARLAPRISDLELARIAEWMQLPLTELPRIMRTAESVVAPVKDKELLESEKELVKRFASPSYDAHAGELTVLINPTSAFRMQMSNPVYFSVEGVQCDLCCATARPVSFQAVLDSGVRSEVVLDYDGCIGFDVCVACGFYYYKSSELRLLRAVHPSPDVRAPYVYGRRSKMVVHSLRADADGGGGDLMVEVVVGISPYGVMPIAWHLPVQRLTALREVCPTVAEAKELTLAQHAALPTPPADWQVRCAMSNISKLMASTTATTGDGDAAADNYVAAAVAAAEHPIDENDTCPICLQLLHSSLPVLRTRCGHWFHVECIGSHFHYKPAVVNGEVNEDNGCPVCRSSDYMPSLESTEAMARTNVYKLRLRIPAAEVQAAAAAGGDGCAVAVGTILTEDGAYHNATNLAACESFHGITAGTRHGTP